MVSNRGQYQYIYYVIFLKVHCLSLMRAALCKLFPLSDKLLHVEIHRSL